MRVRADTAGFHGEAQRGVMGSIGKIATMAGAALATIGAAKIFTGAVKSAGDFQTSLNVLQATSNATDAQMKKVSATAMKLGADVRLPAVSAKDAANAMLELAKGGFTAGQAMDAARGVLLLSTAAEIDGAAAATLVADGLHAFGLKASEATVLVDDFAGAANVSTATMNDVGLALQQSGQAFHQLGIPVGDATTAIAAMANAGIKGSDAGTSLKTMLRSLTPETKQAKQAFKDMNIDVFDQNGKFIGLDKTIAQFAPKLKAMTQEQRAHALNVIFGSDAARAANIILGMSVKQYEALREKVEKSGQAQKLAEARTKGFNGAMQALRSSLENLQLKIGLAVIPKLTELFNWLGKLAGAKNISVAVSIIWEGVKSFASDVASAVNDAMFGSSHIVRIGGRTNVVHVDPGLVAAIGDALQKAIEDIDWTRAGTSIANRVQQATRDGSKQADWRSTASQFLTDFQTNLTNLASGFSFAVGQFFGTTIRLAVGDAFRAVTSNPAVIIQAARSIAETYINSMLLVIKPGLAAIGGVVSGLLGTSLSSAGRTARSGAQEAARLALDGFKALPGEVLSLATTAAVNLAKGILSAPGRIAGLRAQLESVILGGMKDLAEAAFTAAGTVGARIAAGIKTAPGRLAGLAGDLAGRISGVVSQVRGSAFTYARGIGFAIADGVISGIGNLASRLIGVLGDAIRGPVNYVRKHVGSTVEEHLAKEIGAPMVQGIIDGIGSLKERLAGALQETITTATARGGHALTAGTKSMSAIFEAWASNVSTKMQAVFSKAQAKIDEYKAKATPTEALLAAQQAYAAWQSVVAAENAAQQAWVKLKADNATAWAELLRTQEINLAKLRASWQATTDDVIIAKHQFDQGLAGAAGNPLAGALIAAEQNYAKTKALFDQGLADEASFVAAWDALEAARHAAEAAQNAEANLASDASEDAHAAARLTAQQGAAALELDAQWTHYTELLAQQDEAQTQIDEARAQNFVERAKAQEGYNAAEQTAYDAYLKARQESEDYANTRKAQKEREFRDNESLALSTNLATLAKQWETHWASIASDAKGWGEKSMTEYAKGIDKGVAEVERSVKGVAALVAKYLKTSSPTELGPMSDLDEWWRGLAPALVSSLDGSSIKAALTDATTPNLGRAGAARAGAQQTTLSLNDRELLESMRMLVEEFRRSRNNGGVTVIAGSGIEASVYGAKR